MTWKFTAVWLVLWVATSANAGDVREVDKRGFDPAREAVVILQVNWGRYWPCADFENAQLQALAFTRLPIDASNPTALELKTRSKLLVDNQFISYAYVIPAGDYAISSFDIKRARSVSDVTHWMASVTDLIPEGNPKGGQFSAASGEIVYIGSFGLDCAYQPMPWRYYVDGRASFEDRVAKFRKAYPALKDIPVTYRLFSTTQFGEEFVLDDPVVK